MAARKSGPVRPPVIDLAARPGQRPVEATSSAAPSAAGLRQPARRPDALFETAEAPQAPRADALPPVERRHEHDAAPSEASAPAAELPPEIEAARQETDPRGATGPGAAVASPLAEASGSESRSPASPPSTPTPAPRRQRIWGPMLTASILGALLGTAVTAGLLSSGLLPLSPGGSQVPARDAFPDLAAIESRLAALEAAPAAPADGEGDAALTSRLDAVEASVSDQAARTETAVAQLTSAPAGQAPAVDLGPLEARIAALDATVQQLQSTPPAEIEGADPEAAALGEQVASLQANSAALAEQMASLQGELEALRGGDNTETQIAALTGSLEETRAELASAQEAIAALTDASAAAEADAALRLPLAVAGLEAAVAAGRPFGPELEAVRLLQPDLAVPEELATTQATGLTPPQALQEQFAAAIPAILAARPQSSDGSLPQAAADWFGQLLVLRPTGDVPGDTPEAVLARIEAAVERGDWAAAAAGFAQLPEPMQTAAGDLPQQMRAQASAQGFLASVRGAAPEEPAP